MKKKLSHVKVVIDSRQRRKMKLALGEKTGIYLTYIYFVHSVTCHDQAA